MRRSYKRAVNNTVQRVRREYPNNDRPSQQPVEHLRFQSTSERTVPRSSGKGEATCGHSDEAGSGGQAGAEREWRGNGSDEQFTKSCESN